MLALLLCAWGSAAYAGRLGCDNNLARQAENEVDNNLKSWRQMYESFKRYAPCDDGALWEAYSDSVVRILAERWEQLPHLQSFVARDARFRQFVLRHIDPTASEDALARVVINASRRCPTGQAQLCDAILQQALAARSRINEIEHPTEKPR
jgi:hypothetical protein